MRVVLHQAKPLSLTLLTVAWLIAALNASANPTAPTVVSGTATFQRTGTQLQVTNSPNTIINWQSFSIGANEVTRFVQQSSASAVLNRVVNQTPTSITGMLQSNGRVFLVNPNGLLFGAGAQINTAAFVATTLNISDTAFSQGNYNVIDGEGTGSTLSVEGNLASTDRLVVSSNGIQMYGDISAVGNLSLQTNGSLFLEGTLTTTGTLTLGPVNINIATGNAYINNNLSINNATIGTLTLGDFPGASITTTGNVTSSTPSTLILANTGGTVTTSGNITATGSTITNTSGNVTTPSKLTVSNAGGTTTISGNVTPAETVTTPSNVTSLTSNTSPASATFPDTVSTSTGNPGVLGSSTITAANRVTAGSSHAPITRSIASGPSAARSTVVLDKREPLF
jgi:filamentous hemagglutinin family protein